MVGLFITISASFVCCNCVSDTNINEHLYYATQAERQTERQTIIQTKIKVHLKVNISFK